MRPSLRPTGAKGRLAYVVTEMPTPLILLSYLERNAHDISHLVGAFLGEGDQSSDAGLTHFHRYGDSVRHGSQWSGLCFNQNASH